ncbi:MAG TPA: hypothetical protein VJQ45_08790 [Ktedonobacterales bacterium]|nr:hypothetical protein [Ktedonobacterales bacterium]
MKFGSEAYQRTPKCVKVVTPLVQPLTYSNGLPTVVLLFTTLPYGS